MDELFISAWVTFVYTTKLFENIVFFVNQNLWAIVFVVEAVSFVHGVGFVHVL